MLVLLGVCSWCAVVSGEVDWALGCGVGGAVAEGAEHGHGAFPGWVGWLV